MLLHQIRILFYIRDNLDRLVLGELLVSVRILELIREFRLLVAVGFVEVRVSRLLQRHLQVLV